MSLLDSIGDKSVKDAIAGLGPMEQQLILALIQGEISAGSALIGQAGQEVRGILDGATITITVKLKEGK